jgi:release factor glutamine methyltransferase
MRPSDVVRRATGYLEAHDVSEPSRTAEILMEHTLGVDRAGIYTRTDGLSTSEARRFGRALSLRCTGTPVQHLTGEQPFRSIVLEVRPGVFVPRPETEILVDVALDSIRDVPDAVVVDVGTGTGAVALSIGSERSDVTVFATDISAAAVELARANADRLGLEVTVLGGDGVEPLPAELTGGIDLVVSNPPYLTEEEYATLPPEVRADPKLALVGGTQMHGKLAADAANRLRRGGWLVVEIGADQGAEVASLLRGGYSEVAVWPDLAGRDRVARGRLP